MGLCQSEEERKQVTQSRDIDKRLKESHEVEERVIKLLLLGTGECGKSMLLELIGACYISPTYLTVNRMMDLH